MTKNKENDDDIDKKKKMLFLTNILYTRGCIKLRNYEDLVKLLTEELEDIKNMVETNFFSKEIKSNEFTMKVGSDLIKKEKIKPGILAKHNSLSKKLSQRKVNRLTKKEKKRPLSEKQKRKLKIEKIILDNLNEEMNAEIVERDINFLGKSIDELFRLKEESNLRLLTIPKDIERLKKKICDFE